MQEGIAYIEEKINAVDAREEDFPKLVMFLNYLRRFWLPLRNVVCVFGNPIRTNNICEAFHRHIPRNFGRHAHLWTMLDKPFLYLQQNSLSLNLQLFFPSRWSEEYYGGHRSRLRSPAKTRLPAKSPNG